MLTRRSFLHRSGLALGVAASGSLEALLARAARAQVATVGAGYGPLFPTLDENTSLPLLMLPDGFRYVSFGWTGDPLADGTPTPPRHDGMAVVTGRGRRVWLVRNHEISGGGSVGAPALTYDPVAGGGTSTVVFNRRTGLVEDARISLAGTVRNCAGGRTPWRSWLTCEETVDALGDTHGWVFEVPALGDATPEPLRDMGRFVHEAVAVEPRTGIVYETEDRGTAGFYRFVPNVRRNLRAGGRLEMLAIDGQPQANLSSGIAPGTELPVTWVPIPDPERAHSPGTADTLGVFRQGFAAGGARFRRLEGAWFARRRVYFVSTSGGLAGQGQVWEYNPRRRMLRLIFESPGQTVLDNPDNLTVTRRGGLILCEDGSLIGSRLIGLDRSGQAFPFAQNNVILAGEKNGIVGDFRGSEWAGATFHRGWLFVNIQSPGITFGITGPWRAGPL